MSFCSWPTQNIAKKHKYGNAKISGNNPAHTNGFERLHSCLSKGGGAEEYSPVESVKELRKIRTVLQKAGMEAAPGLLATTYD